MTHRERVLTLFNRQTPDRLPKEIKMTPPLLETFKQYTGAEDPAEYYDLEVREVYLSEPQSTPDFSSYYPDRVPPLWSPPGWEVGEWGVGSKPAEKSFHFIHIEHPMTQLTSVDELRVYPFPDYADPMRSAHLKEQVKAFHDRGLFVVGFMEWTIFEIAWHMRGMDNLFMDLAFNPTFAEYLLKRITEIRCAQAKAYAEAGVDLIKIGDDLGTQRSLLMSADMYRQWFKPCHRAVIEAARSVNPNLLISYHSDGNCWDIITDFIDVGISILNPVQPECLDIERVKREFGADLMFWGGVGTQTTMPFETPEKVFDSVRRTIDILGPSGFYPCPTHVLEPEVPMANIDAYLRAVESYN